MKILVINSPLFRDKNPRYDEDSLPPIGLGLIATALKDKKVDVSLIDAVAGNIHLRELVSALTAEKPDFICTNVFTTNFELVKEFVEAIKFKTHFIIGGLSTKTLYREIFKWANANPIDIVHGDGELITVDIVFNLLRQPPSAEDGNKRFFTVDNSSIYYVKDISGDKLDRSFFVNEPVIHPFGFTEANIITSRGCIYNCAFCAAARSLNKEFSIREKSTSSIITEIEQLVDIYPGLESIRVLDDLFLKTPASVKKAIEVFSLFNLQWRSMAHVETFRSVDEATMQSLRQSGCTELFIGIESGSPRILKRIHKIQNVDLIKENLLKLLRNGINIKGYFIYGFPEETIEDFEMTFALASELKEASIRYGSQFRTSVFQYRPYHGTELYHMLEAEYGNSTFSQVSAVEPDNKLSELVGRLQFNFHSGNYSVPDEETLRHFIYKTTNLNSLTIFVPNEKNRDNYRPNTKMQKLRTLRQPISLSR